MYIQYVTCAGVDYTVEMSGQINLPAIGSWSTMSTNTSHTYEGNFYGVSNVTHSTLKQRESSLRY